jgi:hypothetical protein
VCIIVAEMGGLLVTHIWCFMYSIHPCPQLYPVPVHMIIPPSLSTWICVAIVQEYISVWYCVNFEFIGILEFLLFCSVRTTQFPRIFFALVMIEEHFEWTTICPA